MGIISDLKAINDVQRIKKNGTAKLSISQITNLLINLPDAQRNLPKEEFYMVYSLYKTYRKSKTKKKMDKYDYFDTAIQIIKSFDEIAPYEKYCGGDEFEFSVMMEELRNKSS